jgi:hypothetical protein
MAIIRKNESFPERPVIIVLYGTPGSGKTSLFNTCDQPILIDCDRGADRAINRQDTVIAKNWQEVIESESEIKNYKTVGIDTAKAVLDDFMMVWVIEKDYKLKTNKLKAYGAIGDEFKAFVNTRRAEGLDMVIIAHAKEEKDGDILRLSPDVTGQSKDLILRIADQVGFLTMVNNKRTLTFEPTDKTIGKNVARIPTMEIPDESDPKFKSFMAEIIARVKSSIRSQSEEQIKAQEIIKEFTFEISECIDNGTLMAVSEKCKGLPAHLQAGMRKLISAKVTELGLIYSKEENKFIEKP